MNAPIDVKDQIPDWEQFRTRSLTLPLSVTKRTELG